MPQLDFPTSPTPGQIYPGSNGVDYTWNATVGVWTAAAGTPLTITSPGSITGTAEVGATLTYATGTATGGVPPYTYTWQWKKVSDNSVLQTGGATYVIVAGLLGDNVYVALTATDSAANTATAVTSSYPTPPATIQPAGITNAVAPTTIPGTASFTWANGAGNLSATGCIEFSIDGGLTWTQSSTPVSNGNTILTQWVDVTGSGLCGDAANGTTITGSLTTGAATTNFSLLIDRVPSAFSLSPSTETTTPTTVTTANPTFTLAGANTAPLVWGVLTGGGSTAEFSIDGGTTWVSLPSVPTSGTYAPVGVATIVRFTTSASVGTETLDVYAGASTTAGEYQSALFTVTVSSPVFPNSVFSPAGAPNASPASVSTASLHGTATCSSWADGSTTLTSTGDIQFQVNGGGYGVGPTAVTTSDTVDVIWDPAAIAGAADNAVLTGTLTDGIYTNTYSITVTRAVSGLSFTDTTGVATSTATTSNVITPSGFNVPVSLSYAGTTSNALTSLGVSVGGGAFNASPQTVNPGQSLQIQGTTGAGFTTAYGVDLTMGSGPVATDTWTATTTANTPTITPPTIVTPSSGSTGQGSFTGITITGSAYSNLNGAGSPQTSSVWEVTTGSAGGTPIAGSPFTVTTGSLTSLTITTPPLAANTQYFVRAQYVTTNATATTSAFGPWSDFTTGDLAIGVGTWTPRTSGTTSQLFSVAWGSGLYAAGGASGTIVTSPDGITWTTRVSSFLTTQINEITYGGSKFVAVGDNGKVATSPDGITWTQQTSGTANGLSGVTYGGSQFVAVGASGTILTSPDGVTWTSRTSGTAQNLFAVTYGNGLYVAGGANGVVRTSTDAITWTARTTPNTNIVAEIVYGNGVYVATYTTGNRLMYSTDAITWTLNASIGGVSGANALAYGGGRFWLGGPNTSPDVATSTDGINWTGANTTLAKFLQGMGYGTPGFVVVGNNGAIASNFG